MLNQNFQYDLKLFTSNTSMFRISQLLKATLINLSSTFPVSWLSSTFLHKSYFTEQANNSTPSLQYRAFKMACSSVWEHHWPEKSINQELIHSVLSIGQVVTGNALHLTFRIKQHENVTMPFRYESDSKSSCCVTTQTCG